jgi:integrase
MTLAMGRPDLEIYMRTKSGTPTRYPGVKRLGPRRFEVRAKAVDPRTGKQKEVTKRYEDVSEVEAARRRQQLIAELRGGLEKKPRRVRVRAYAEPWLKSKSLKLSKKTGLTYANAMEQHVLPIFGDLFYDAVTPELVQEWIDDSLLAEWRTPSGERRRYSPQSIHCWYRVFRTMTRDAVWSLGLKRDPTMRIDFPPSNGSTVSKALSSEALAKFLAAMQRRYPQHYALTVTLAFTGMRFGPVCALRWEDWQEQSSVLFVSRKYVGGEMAPISRKKLAPAEFPVEPELAEVLRWHRRRLLAAQAPGFQEGWMFPASNGALRTPSSLQKAWRACIAEAGIEKPFTIHGLRYTFTDLSRRARIDPVVRRALTGHVTEQMQRHYSNVGIDEKRSAVAGVHALVALRRPGGGTSGGT